MKTNNGLDAQQQAAVDSNEPCIVCCAAAGSGKTRTLISRIQRLVRDGVDPAKIAAVTFTVAGAKVMQERLPGVRLGFVGNLHSLSLRMLQQHACLIGLPATVTVLDDEAAAALLEQCRERLRVKCTDKELKEAVAYMREATFADLPHPTKAQLVALEYHLAMRRGGTLDFDAILDYMLELVTGYRDDVVLFDYLFCDEMQDAADIDWNIYDAMLVNNEFYVGDDSQSIFGFRGSNVKRFVGLTKKSGVSVMNLSTNYRSSMAVIDAATTLIQHNKNRVENNMWAREGAPEGSVEVKQFPNANAELSWIAKTISDETADVHWMEQCGEDEQRHREDCPCDGTGAMPQQSIAVLWRTNALACQCADYLRGLGVKVAESERPAADSPEAKLGKAALAFMSNQWNESAALRFIELNSGAENIGRIKVAAAAELSSACFIIHKYNPNFCLAASEKEYDMVSINSAIRLMRVKPEAEKFIIELAKTLSSPFTLGDLLLAAARPEAEAKETDGMFVGTAHSAKGREWDCVIVGGMEAECWENKSDDPASEDDRRLAYVAMTRAKTRLILTHVSERQNPFKHWLMDKRTPSRFLKEIVA